MIEAKSIDNGNAIGTILGMKNTINFKIRVKSRSFPASSEIKSQTVCKMKIKKRITNTEVNVVRNVFRMYLSRIFT